MLIRVVDVETTGIPGSEGAAVCEIGWCDITANGDCFDVETEPHSMFCDPGCPISPEARAVHHISDADVAGAPSPDVAFRHLVEGPPAILAAHNAAFEQSFFSGDGIAWICTWKVSLRLWPDAPSHKNQVLRYWLGLSLPDGEAAMPPHRAGPDAYVTAHILATALRDGRASIDDMLRWSSGPALLPRITFGKHRGSRWEDAPSDYLRWIADKSEMDADVKANARHHLKRRAMEKQA